MAKLLWKPSEERIKSTNMYRFMNVINEKYNQDFNEYEPLYQWSIENIPDFWASMWEFAEIRASQPYTEVVDDLTKMPGAKWFSGAKLNFAENLLRFRDDHVALIFKGEAQQYPGKIDKEITAELPENRSPLMPHLFGTNDYVMIGIQELEGLFDEAQVY